MDLDYKLISDVVVEDIDTKDYPDFVDAFIASALYDGKEMTDAQLEEINEDGDFIHEQTMNQLY